MDFHIPSSIDYMIWSDTSKVPPVHTMYDIQDTQKVSYTTLKPLKSWCVYFLSKDILRHSFAGFLV